MQGRSNREQLAVERDRLQQTKLRLEEQRPLPLRRIAAVKAQLSLIQQLLGPDLYDSQNKIPTSPIPMKGTLFIGRNYPKWWNSIQWAVPRPKTKKKFAKRRLLMGVMRALCSPRSRQAGIKTGQ